jgi:hypothetical protein
MHRIVSPRVLYVHELSGNIGIELLILLPSRRLSFALLNVANLSSTGSIMPFQVLSLNGALNLPASAFNPCRGSRAPQDPQSRRERESRKAGARGAGSAETHCRRPGHRRAHTRGSEKATRQRRSQSGRGAGGLRTDHCENAMACRAFESA